MRKSEERGAARLESRGWLCVPPEHAHTVRALIASLRDGEAK